MDFKELRVGNLVFTHKEEIICVNGLGIDGYILLDKEHNIADIMCKPIPLTEEWVIDFGLNMVEVDNGDLFYQNNKFRLNSNYAGFYHGRNLDIKYVHQLQNLYFALTGEELTIKK